MQRTMASAIALLLVLLAGPTQATENPAVTKVIHLITELKYGVMEDGKKEQKSYDKFACWCEDTLARKARDIAEAKEAIPKMQELIVKLKAEIAAHNAEITQLEKDIKENSQAQKDATAVRDKEYAEYAQEVRESEQCIGALEAATKALTGAGTGKKTGFLETLREAQLVSVAANVRKVMDNDQATSSLSDTDLRTLRAFVDHPDAISQSRRKITHAAQQDLSAAQVNNNPFGDYAPQSTQIQGILKGMYDSFAYSMEKAHGEEADKQKNYEAFMATKKAEQATLELTYATQTGDKAAKTKDLATTKTDLDNTKNQLEADEEFFADTKTTCKARAVEWAQRSRLRTEELTGINQAIDILSAPDAQQIFANSSSTFLQLHKTVNERRNSNGYKFRAKARVRSAYSKLQSMASKYGSLGLANIAAAVMAPPVAGHFEKVIAMIDNMIELLRKEEQEDIAHKDRCENALTKNKNDKEDLEALEKKLDEEIKELEGKVKDLGDEIKKVLEEIGETEDNMKERLEIRNREQAEFEQALKDDADAVALIKQARKAMAQFYKNNKIDMELLQKHSAPEYTVDPDKAPELSWGKEGGKYGGRNSESSGIVAILSMIAEDIEMEMKTAREDNAEAQEEYDTDRKAMEKMLDTQVQTKVELEKTLSENEAKKVSKEADLDETIQELKNQDELAATLKDDCDWMQEPAGGGPTKFQQRRDKRKTEIQGMQEAKEILSQVDAGDYNQLDMSAA